MQLYITRLIDVYLRYIFLLISASFNEYINSRNSCLAAITEVFNLIKSLLFPASNRVNPLKNNSLNIIVYN